MNAASGMSPANSAGCAASSTAVARLEAIGAVVSSLDVARVRSREEMTRALCALELANKCIGVVLNEVRGTCVRDQLIGESERLTGLIDLAREKLAALRVG